MDEEKEGREEGPAPCPAAQLSVAVQTSGTAYGKLRCRGKQTVLKGWPGRKPIHLAEHGRPVDIWDLVSPLFMEEFHGRVSGLPRQHSFP